MSEKIRFIDLFAGLGGIRIGFTQAAQELGLETECVFTSEIKESALKALNENFPNEGIVKTDITKVDGRSIPNFSILLGGFPCQAFSFAGHQKGFLDTRGTLFFEIERILKDHLRDVDGFLLENVEGLLVHDKENTSEPIGKTLKVILAVLRKLGYNTEFALLNAADFGVAQKRKRVYIVGCKKKFGSVDLRFEKKKSVCVSSCIEYGKKCLDTPFTRKLLSSFAPSELEGRFLKDKRGGILNIHSWDFGYKGIVSDRQKELLNTLYKQRRRRSWAPIIGIDWMDGMPLTTSQISTFFRDEHLQEMLDDLTKKGYLTLEHPKKKVIATVGANSYSTRVQDTTLAKGYNIVTGKLSFPISHILDSNSQAPTIVAMDMNALGIVDGRGLRRLSLREGLRLFGYPESYSLKMFEKDEKSIRLGYDLLGNSVCVPVIKEVSKRLLYQIHLNHG